VILVDSQIDHTTGLLLMRESAIPLSLYCTARVHQDLSTGFPVLNILEHYCGVEWFPIPIDGSPFRVAAVPDLSFTAVPLRSKAPPYSPHRNAPAPGDNIGLVIEDVRRGRRLFYAPGLGEFEDHLTQVMDSAHCLLVDGTAWHDDDLCRRGVGSRRASEMGHLAQWGPGGMIERLRPFDTRKILIHINNTNPILDGASDERIRLAAEGIEVAYDGMQFFL
jgi:pyrroloquinoline quinone biosynthesis protein B